MRGKKFVIGLRDSGPSIVITPSNETMIDCITISLFYAHAAVGRVSSCLPSCFSAYVSYTSCVSVYEQFNSRTPLVIGDSGLH